MSPDAGRHAGSRWSLLEQRSFVMGRCDSCGFTTPARRARYSVEIDMEAHLVLCAAEVVDRGLDMVAEAPEPDPESMTSGRERLSAQGRS